MLWLEHSAFSAEPDTCPLHRWRWALQPEVRRIRQRAMRQVLWSEQRRRRALQEPEADTEAPALGSAAAFCMRAAVSEGEHEPAEDSGDEESVLDLWGDDPGDFTDSEVHRVGSKQHCFECERLVCQKHSTGSAGACRCIDALSAGPTGVLSAVHL